MLTRTRFRTALAALIAAAAIAGCADAPTRPLPKPAANLNAVKFWHVTAGTRWNERALALLAPRPDRTQLPNLQAAASRVLTYLSIAQYRAVLAAEKSKDGSTHPSVSAAVGAASVAVLSSFFPLDASALEGHLDADLAAAPWPGAKHEDPVSGEAIGRSIGASVLALAATDNYLVASPVKPVPDGGWVSNGTPIVRSLYRVRPFFWTPEAQSEVLPPPDVGSQLFQDALAEVRSISDTRTTEQVAIAQRWGLGITIGLHNQLADDLIRKHRRTEREAARILAYGNVATFDAQIACWETKITYWYIRPSQADPLITIAPLITQPNHPSYPSGHSCVTSGILTVLVDAFPSERAMLNARIEEAGLSRLYGGIHYRFDIEAGQAIGRRAAALALAGTLE